MGETNVKDERILALLANGETADEGFRLLVDTHAERMYWRIRQIVLVHADADDVLQNALLKVYRHIGKFNGQSKLYTWLYRIATNEALSFKKRQGRKPTETLDGMDENWANRMRADSYFDGDEAEILLQRALLSLPDRQRQVFRLRYFDEMTYKEIAALLGLSVGALKASYHHALNKIEAYVRSNQSLRE